ncbi:MAG TPA: hypothetical protein VIY47_10535 [Ignavibacteriaceae bacterium]
MTIKLFVDKETGKYTNIEPEDQKKESYLKVFYNGYLIKTGMNSEAEPRQFREMLTKLDKNNTQEVELFIECKIGSMKKEIKIVGYFRDLQISEGGL